MNRRPFRPTGLDALESRIALTAFVVPFAIVKSEPAGEVEPKYLVLTKHSETQISDAIRGDFARLTHAGEAAVASYDKAVAKPKANVAALQTQFEVKVVQALTRLTSDMGKVASKVPFGGKNLAPVLEARIVGGAGVTDTTTKVNTPSLESDLIVDAEAGDVTAALHAVESTEASVRVDVKDYINLGVTNKDFKLGRGAILPALS